MNSESLVFAMLYGDFKQIPSEILFLFARTGLIHLFSASGFHIAVAVWMARSLTYPIKKISRIKQKKISFIFSLLFMIFLGEKIGWSTPMVRAFSFVLLKTTANLIGFKENIYWIFLISLLISSLFGNGSMLSFLLSAAGMAGILFFPNRMFLWGPWLTTLPICIYFFHTFSLAAPIWNLVLGNLIALTALPLAFIHLFVESLGGTTKIFLQLSAYLMKNYVHFLYWGDKWFGGSYWVPEKYWLGTIALLCISTILMKKNILFGSIALGLSIALLSFLPKPSFHILNVGQGDSIYLQTPSSNFLIDTGKKYFASNELERLGIADIENILITHPDLDHRGGLESILARHNVKKVWIREQILSMSGTQKILEDCELANIPVFFISSKLIPYGLDCLFSPLNSRNNTSPLCTAKLINKKKILLTGDMDSKAESWFLENLNPFPHADYLKIAHHGSKYSSQELFLQATGAKEAFISVGKNSYGHPSPQTIERLNHLNINTLRTDKWGTITIF